MNLCALRLITLASQLGNHTGWTFFWRFSSCLCRLSDYSVIWKYKTEPFHSHSLNFLHIVPQKTQCELSDSLNSFKHRLSMFLWTPKWSSIYHKDHLHLAELSRDTGMWSQNLGFTSSWTVKPRETHHLTIASFSDLAQTRLYWNISLLNQIRYMLWIINLKHTKKLYTPYSFKDTTRRF